MAKNIIGFFILCLILFRGNIVSQPVIESYPVIPSTTELRKKLIEFEQSQVGIKEATGNNDGKEVEKYLKSVGLKRGDAWCAAGQSWCHIQLNIPNPETGYSPNWFKTNVVYKKEHIRILPFKYRGGEVVGFWVPGKGRIGHVGMAKYEDDLHVITTEFNASNSVRNLIRKKTDIFIVSDFVGYREILQAMKK